MAIENFLTYTLEDVNGKLTTTASRITGEDVDRDEDVWRIKDKGVDHFDALDIDFEIYVASTSGPWANAGMGIANTIGSRQDFASTDITVFGVSASPPEGRIYLIRGNGVAFEIYVASYNTLYYLTLERAAGNDTVSLKIYSDAERTNLLDTLALAGFGTTKWRYIYGFVNLNSGSSGTDWDGYVQNLNLEVLIISPTSIPSAEAFGSLTVSPGGVSVAPSGISSQELLGLPKLNLFVTPSGIVTGEAFGAAQLNLKLILTAIASAEAFGAPIIAGPILVTGIPSAEQFGSPILAMILVIRPLGIASLELFGSPLLIVILAKGTDIKLPPGTPGQTSIPSGEVSIPSKEVSI